MFQRLLRVALWNALSLVTVVDLLPSTQAAFFVCPSSCEAKLLPRDMETLEDCICHGSTSKLHDNNHGDGKSPQHHGIFRCPEGAAARMLHPMSFADCACLAGFTRDDTHKKSRNRPVKSLADCMCMDPFVKNDQSGECLIDQPFQCPPNSSPVANVRPKSAVDCHCDWGFVKTKKGHECVRESAAYICPRDSSRRTDLPFGMQPRGFFDCKCLQTGEYKRNEWTQSCDEITMGSNQNRGEEVFSCPPFAKPLAAIPHSVEQCECLPGYGWKTPEMICVRMSAYACPAHSYLNAEETNKHVEETFDDCACTNGYYRDETLQRCLEWFLANDNGCPKYAFLKHWPLQSQANCQCVYGLKPENEQAPAENASKKALRQQKKKAAPECASPPSMTPEGDKFTFSECPVNAFANNWPLAH
uniref:EGF-like domain-containing protein n=1 Tax=Globisporangium ultimum (strain ATCC 200006 / CBS 805.95 / DAOM BR144) TaxID=431595 RepID=K3WLZ2_GLOUD